MPVTSGQQLLQASVQIFGGLAPKRGAHITLYASGGKSHHERGAYLRIHTGAGRRARFCRLTQVLAQAVLNALSAGRRVVVEHFELIYPLLNVNAQLLIGIGDEIIVCRPTLFGPEPEDISDIVHKSIKYRRMAHSAEDLSERFLDKQGIKDKEYEHDDVRHGFMLRFRQQPQFDLAMLENYVKSKIERDLPISYVDNDHIRVGENLHRCTGPRMHVSSTGKIENFRVLPQVHYDVLTDTYLLVGLVGDEKAKGIRDLNKIDKL